MNEDQRMPGSVIEEGGGYDLPLAKRSVGQGWHPILERLFLAKPEWIRVVQVKEKFGGLRFYIDDRPVIGERADQLRAFEKLIQEAEAESFTVRAEKAKDE